MKFKKGDRIYTSGDRWREQNRNIKGTVVGFNKPMITVMFDKTLYLTDSKYLDVMPGNLALDKSGVAKLFL